MCIVGESQIGIFTQTYNVHEAHPVLMLEGFLLHNQAAQLSVGVSSAPSLFDFLFFFLKVGFPSETKDFISEVKQSGKESNAPLLTLALLSQPYLPTVDS